MIIPQSLKIQKSYQLELSCLIIKNCQNLFVFLCFYFKMELLKVVIERRSTTLVDDPKIKWNYGLLIKGKYRIIPPYLVLLEYEYYSFFCPQFVLIGQEIFHLSFLAALSQGHDFGILCVICGRSGVI